MAGPRAVFFDAGNTLVSMNYQVIAGELAAHGVAGTATRVQEAEWRARVRLDTDVLARLAPGTSTESPSTGGRYLGCLLEELGVTDAATLEAVTAWRRGYNAPVGVWETADPEAEEALTRLREAGLRAAVISNSNGSVPRAPRARAPPRLRHRLRGGGGGEAEPRHLPARPGPGRPRAGGGGLRRRPLLGGRPGGPRGGDGDGPPRSRWLLGRARLPDRPRPPGGDTPDPGGGGVGGATDAPPRSANPGASRTGSAGARRR